MRLATAVFTATAATGFASVAVAASQFGELDTVCLKTGAEPAAAVAAADASGWLPVPRDMTQKWGPEAAAATSRMKTTEAEMLLLFLATEKDRGGSVNNVCTMVSTPADPTFAEEAATWAAVPGTKVKDGAGYGFIELPDRHLDPDKVPDTPADFDVHSHLRYLGVLTRNGQTTAIYTAATKSPD